MILELQCTSREMSGHSYTISKEGGIAGHAIVPVKKVDGGFEAKITFPGETMRLHIPSLFSKMVHKQGLESTGARFQAGDVVGRILRETRKGRGLFGGYWLWPVEVDGKIRYEIYEIGLGRKGRYFVLKDGDKTLAMVSIAMRSTNFLTKHRIYVRDKAYAALGVILALFWDFSHFAGVAPRPGRHVQDHKLNTLNKEVKRQFDPDFIPAVQGMD